MSTNYYCRILPSHERKQELHDAIEKDDFPLIKEMVSEMYGSIEKGWDTQELVGGVVHLGKRASGWKFLWNPNVYVKRNGHLEDTPMGRKYVSDPDEPIYLYPLTKKGLKAFIDREDVFVYDEYEELQDKEEFWKMALSWGYDKKDEGWDAASYEREHLTHMYPITGELTDLLRQEDYEFTSSSHSDFYSDGLRFAGFTEFS